MRIYNRKTLRDYKSKYPDAASALSAWQKTVESAAWQHLMEVRKVYPSVDAAGNFTIFDICGNKYRLIAAIDYQKQFVYLKYFLTHAEYDKEDWKNDRYF